MTPRIPTDEALQLILRSYPTDAPSHILALAELARRAAGSFAAGDVVTFPSAAGDAIGIVALVNAYPTLADKHREEAATIAALREVADGYEALHRVPFVAQRVNGYEEAHRRAHTTLDAARTRLANLKGADNG